MKESILRGIGVFALALLGGLLGAGLFAITGIGQHWADRQTEAYLLDNPEMLQRMASELQARDAERRLAAAGEEWRAPFPGAVLGNPEGSRTLFEFSDYNCGYCRLSHAHVEQLVAQDPELRVVIKEWPIFEGSEAAARMALAAAKQDKFAAFHRALFEQETADDAAIARAAEAAGLDVRRARTEAQGEDVTMELMRNALLAEELGFTGTPAWITGNRILQGAQGVEALAEAIGDTTDAS
ncbi:DsbA family protein [Alteriqipengyuania lutimaris]|uniref:DsbA family protein n=1 Tax=Alteriqipengyuania lutimaris TaxID=1538146 RepID=A0A395LIS8_9SPHN|nr:DsbA family protein [Alteriqipengyuania lutimaris]MBB3034260.1 putative DsbA family dithiol-disulfide isomerase [Alteriqipengyuania lutimaris]RDS76828.1 DsbA family protein [Alteriqipengyuania lutimaris]